MEGMLTTVVLCGVLAAAVVLGIRSYLKKLKTGCCGSGGDSVKQSRPRDTNLSHYPYTKTVRIEGMHCQNCARRVENAFHAREGYFVKVNLSKQEALVRTKTPVSEEELKQVIRSLGYRVVEVR